MSLSSKMKDNVNILSGKEMFDKVLVTYIPLNDTGISKVI